MSGGDWFVVLITTLDVGAAILYSTKRLWWDAGIWMSFALANVALLCKTLSTR